MLYNTITALIYYIWTLPDAFIARRELFTPVKYNALVGFVFSSFLWQVIDLPGANHVFGISAAMFITTFLAITFLAPSIVETAAKALKIIGKKEYEFPEVYLAHTGYYDDNVPPRPILGLYAGQFISSG
jgi:hypothetical protein